MQYIMEYSEFLNKPANKWMKQIIEIIRHTSLYSLRDKNKDTERRMGVTGTKTFLNDKKIRAMKLISLQLTLK